MGTALSELTLPDTLEAVVTEQLSEDAEDKTDGGGKADAEEDVGKKDTGENGGEESDDTEDEDGGTGDTEDEDGSIETEEREPADPEPEDTETGGETGDNDAETGDGQDEQPENGESEETDGTAATENGDEGDTETEENSEGESAPVEEQGGSENEQENTPSEERQESAPAQETHTVTMQEYHAENVVPVQTLENTQTEKQEETVTIDGVTWQSEPEYDENTEGIYIFTAVLPEGYTLAEGVSLPEITVTVKESESGTDTVIQTLLDRIAALPDVEKYLATEPDMEEDEDAYTEWEEKLYEYAEEALAIWEEYEALTGEQQAQITEGELAKLEAWLEIAETLSDNNAVMLAGYSEHHGESNWTALTASGTTLTNGKYYLSGDIEMGTITINGGDVMLCLNGHKLQHDNTSGSVIVVGSGTFTLCDCQDHWGYTSSFDESSKTYSCEMTGTGGCITGGRGTENDIGNICGGGIFVRSGATFNMNSGRITGCGVGTGVKLYGGGVYVTGGTFNMSSGFLDGNMANCGGGVYIENKAGFTMSGNAIVMNNEGDAGGGVYILDGTFNMTSGNILGNKGGGYGGGAIMVGGGTSESPASFIMSGGMIEGNTIKDAVQSITAGIYCNGGTLILSEGSIQHNIGNTEAAGGIRMLAGTLEVSGNIRISDNYGWNGANNLSLARNCTITVTGELSNDIGVTYRPARGTVSYPLLVVKGTNSYSISDADWSHFSSDNEKYEIQKKETTDTGNELYLAEPGKCNLFNLTTDDATLSPLPFDPNTTEYTSEVANSVDQVGITATLASTASGANITIKINDGTTEEMENGVLKTVNLAEGENTIVITVTSGEMSKAYTIKITREIQETPTEYKVTLHGNGGGAGTDLTSYTYGTKVTLPTDWTKTGYTFAGWYDNENCTGTEAKEISDTATGDKEYWASWTPTSYFISYDLDGGAVTGNPTSYTIENSAITLINPTKAGYSFGGWSGTDLTGSNNMSVTIAAGSTGNREYTAHWTAADYTVTLNGNGGKGGTSLISYAHGTGAILPTDWMRAGYSFAGWYDNENCTGTAVTSISASDTGNKEYWAKWTDNIAPVIDTLTYNYQPQNLWHWLIGKDSLVITVPVTEEGSGADKIDYNVTPDGGTAKVETATIQNGEAKITVSADFKGTISITCTDKAGNISAGVTVGAGVAQNGIIIEDNAPAIAFKAENAELLSSGEYKTVPDIVVTVADDKDNAISAGIASASYKIGDGSVKTVPHDYTASMVLSDSFTIQASEIPAGGAVISVTATDNAGNSTTETYTVKVHTHSGTLVAAVDPTCTTAGNKQHYTCACGKWFSDSGCTNEITDKGAVVLDALGHYFEGQPYQVTTTQHWRKCSRCSVTEQKEDHSFGADDKCTVCGYSKVVDPGHTHSGTLVAATNPTCTLPGNIAYYSCSSCGKLFSDSGCTVEITEQDTKIEALKHDFSVTEYDQSEHWKKCSRCTEEQSRESHVYDNDTDTECNVCGYVRTLQGHTHSGTLVAAKPATCTQDGHEAYYTCDCGKWFTDSACANEITDHASVVVGKLGHNFVGEYLFDANGHWRVCSRCNAAQTPESHVFDDDNDTTCNKCNYQRTIGTHTHSGTLVAATDPTCTTAGNKAHYRCSCGKWFSDSSCTKEVTAQDVTIPAKGHTAVTDPAKAATCTETGLSEGSHCSVCGHVIKAQTVTAALGHDYSGNYHYDAGGHWKVCSRCGTVSAKQRHNYDNDRDTKCNDCDWVRTISDSDNEQDEQPTPIPTPEPPVQPTPIPQPTPTPGTTPPVVENESEGRNPETTPEPEETPGTESEEPDNDETQPTLEPSQTQIPDTMPESQTYAVGNGAVIVTLNNVDETVCTARVADASAVAHAVLSEGELAEAEQGQIIEIRIDVERLEVVPQKDAEVIGKGIEDCQEQIPGLVMGMYADISMYMRIGSGDWNAIHATNEPVEIILDVPDELAELTADFYIMRAHEGEYLLMEDLDEMRETITIQTEAFSTYAILYHLQESGEKKLAAKCSLCHICPTFLGICYFIWLAIIIALVLVTYLVIQRKRKQEESEEQ